LVGRRHGSGLCLDIRSGDAEDKGREKLMDIIIGIFILILGLIVGFAVGAEWMRSKTDKEKENIYSLYEERD
jgi:hypothetical protein